MAPLVPEPAGRPSAALNCALPLPQSASALTSNLESLAAPKFAFSGLRRAPGQRCGGLYAPQKDAYLPRAGPWKPCT